MFINVINLRAFIKRKSEYRRAEAKERADIQANVTIVCRHNIDHYAFAGAGSMMTKNMPDYATVYGNPAQIQGWGCRCGEQLNTAGIIFVRCLAFGKSFKFTSDHQIEELG